MNQMEKRLQKIETFSFHPERKPEGIFIDFFNCVDGKCVAEKIIGYRYNGLTIMRRPGEPFKNLQSRCVDGVQEGLPEMTIPVFFAIANNSA